MFDNHSRNRVHWAYRLAAAALFVGYLFMMYYVIGFDSNNSNKEALEALRIQSEVYHRHVLQLQSELRALKAQGLPKSTKSDVHAATVADAPLVSITNTATRPGVIILGMHRSGTSALGGLMNKMGLKTGGPLIQAAEDNAKGFFERIDVVLQNDYLMRKQQVHYSLNTYKYDPLIAIKHILTDDGSLFKEGKRGLAFLNNPESYPWMLKDPRLCITLRTWLPLLNFIPAVVFTYRHPMDVALSMNKREFEKFAINKGLRMWYVYNRRAVEQSKDLCRVVTSHRKIMRDPQIELDRVFDELTQCGVNVPHKLNPVEIADFIDVKLQHGKSTQIDDTCNGELDNIKPPSSWPTSDIEHIRLYREVMRVYCAMEDGTAFQRGFKFAENVKDN